MFSKEDITKAKGVSLIDVMEKYGHQLVPGKSTSQNAFFKSPFTDEKTPSFRVHYSNNTFVDFSSSLSGTGIDLIQNLEHCTFQVAVNKLLQMAGASPAVVRTPAPAHIEKIRRVIPLANEQLIAYLRDERKINIEIAKRHVKQIEWTVDRNDGKGSRFYFGIAFETNKGGAYAVRNKHFKGFVGEGANNSPTFIPGLTGNTTTLNVFEGFTDFLTILTRKGVDTLKFPSLILNSIVFKNLVNTDVYDTFNAFVDNDNGGQQVVDYLQTVGKVNDMRGMYAGYNDLNEYHIHTPVKFVS